MHVPPDLPDVMVVRVRTAGGPYAVAEMLSVAFTKPGVGRLITHACEPSSEAVHALDGVIPESITVEVLRGASPYATGDWLILSFIDPTVARIISTMKRDVDSATVPSTRELDATKALAPEDAFMLATVRAFTEEPDSADEPREIEVARAWARLANAIDSETDDRPVSGVRVRLQWNSERALRFVRVVDKLFTVDRLGWYRHVLAVRLVVADFITTGDAVADVEAGRHLHALRTAVTHTLGSPMLAACMPNFSVTPEWLDELDSAGAARAIGALRDSILPYVNDAVAIDSELLDSGSTVGTVTRRELLAAPPASLDALLPLFVPSLCALAEITESLSTYRATLIDVFGQTAGSAEAVRLNVMSQPNHVLDDRLWHLVGAVGKSYVDRAS